MDKLQLVYGTCELGTTAVKKWTVVFRQEERVQAMMFFEVFGHKQHTNISQAVFKCPTEVFTQFCMLS